MVKLFGCRNGTIRVFVANKIQTYNLVMRMDSSFSVSAAKRRMPSESRSVAMASSTPHPRSPRLPFSIQRKVASSSSKYSLSQGQFSADRRSYGSYASHPLATPTSAVQSFSCCSRLGAMVSLSQPARPRISSTERKDAPITTVFTPFFL